MLDRAMHRLPGPHGYTPAFRRGLVLWTCPEADAAHDSGRPPHSSAFLFGSESPWREDGTPWLSNGVGHADDWR